jgi:guanine deaminase
LFGPQWWVTMQLYLAEIWHMKQHADSIESTERAFETFQDGALLVGDDGKVLELGERNVLASRYPDAKMIDWRGKLLVPGFIDAHLHFPQIDLIGLTGETLLGWLDRYTYPTEITLGHPANAKPLIEPFFNALLSQGTTGAALFGSHSAVITNLLFQEAERRGLRAVIGKLAMDRESPPGLWSTIDEQMAHDRELIQAWHGKEGRLFLSMTPRFAISCSDAMLSALGDLKRTHPTLYVHSHFSEDPDEIAFTKKLFPGVKDYLSVYDRFSLLGPRTLLAHGIHATADERELAARTGTRIVHCPTSNTFIGSGLFPMETWIESKVPLSLGTDIGGGTSTSVWQTMGEAYKVQKLRNKYVSPAYLFYLATLGGAKALSWDGVTGNFEKGQEADFQLLNPMRHPLLQRRWSPSTALEKLAALCFMADDRMIEKVYVRGREVYNRML